MPTLSDILSSVIVIHQRNLSFLHFCCKHMYPCKLIEPEQLLCIAMEIVLTCDLWVSKSMMINSNICYLLLLEIFGPCVYIYMLFTNCEGLHFKSPCEVVVGFYMNIYTRIGRWRMVLLYLLPCCLRQVTCYLHD